MVTSIEWKFIRSMGFSDHHHAVFRNDEFGVQRETITRKNHWGEFLKPKNFFFIDNDEREFLTEEELIDAYNEKFPRDGDTTEAEVKYVRIIVKRQK